METGSRRRLEGNKMKTAKKSAFDDYVPFGDEYKAHLMKLPKKHLIDLFIGSAKKNLEITSLIDEMIEEYKGSAEEYPLTELKEKIK